MYSTNEVANVYVKYIATETACDLSAIIELSCRLNLIYRGWYRRSYISALVSIYLSRPPMEWSFVYKLRVFLQYQQHPIGCNVNFILKLQ